MEKYSQVLGLPVICSENGREMGNVSDVIFNPSKREVKGFIIEKKGMGIRKKAVLLEDILNVGKDLVLVKCSSSIKDIRTLEEEGKLEGKGEIAGLKVFSKTGEDLGTVKDIWFDSRNGLVEGVEVSDGIFQDIMQGRKVMPLVGKVEFGKESIVVGRDSVEEIMETGGGIKNRLFGEE